jgi:hypothetical protein
LRAALHQKSRGKEHQLNSTIEINRQDMLSQQLKDEYVQAWVAQGAARAEWLRGDSDIRDLNRAQVRVMRAMLEIAKDCADADHYAACKTTLDREAYGQLRQDELYSFGSWLSSPSDTLHNWAYQKRT